MISIIYYNQTIFGFQYPVEQTPDTQSGTHETNPGRIIRKPIGPQIRGSDSMQKIILVQADTNTYT